MELSPRELDVLHLVGRFTQLASTHLKTIVFNDRSHAVPTRVLKKLEGLGYLDVVGTRSRGKKGGSAPYVYKLGKLGRELLGIKSRSLAVSNHALKVADVYVELLEADRAKTIKLISYRVEAEIDEVRSDLLVHIGLPGTRTALFCSLEIDLGWEQPTVLERKLRAYWRAKESTDDAHFPFVVLLVPDSARLNQVQRVIRRLPDQQHMLFHVFTYNDVVGSILSLVTD